MIKVIEFVFRMLVLATFGTVAVFGLIFCALLLWKGRYIDLADECTDLLMYGKKQDQYCRSSGLTRIKSQTMDKAYRKKLIQQADDAAIAAIPCKMLWRYKIRNNER